MTHRQLVALVTELAKRIRKLERAAGSRPTREERDEEREREREERERQLGAA